jgi:hypothetical protein
VKRNGVEMRGTPECFKARQADAIVARPVIGFAEAFPDSGAAAR